MMRHLAHLMLAAAAFAAVPGRAADPVQGQRLYAMRCASCHGVNGSPVMPAAPDFTRAQTLMQPDQTLMLKIKVGRNAMPGYAGLLKDREILDIIAYMRTLR